LNLVGLAVRRTFAALVGLGVGLLPLLAEAASLRRGDVLSVSPDLEALQDPEPASLGRFGASREEGGLALQFTPRNPLSLLFGDSAAASPEPAELRLSVAGEPDDSARWSALDASAPADGETLEIGGALHWSDWTLGSAYARTALFGGDADLVSATLGYGRMSARLALGQTESVDPAGDLDVLMLSTDLAAWSWLTLETDLAMGAPEDSERETLAVGRFGIRLNF
jgi:hypothetical protein